MSKTQIPITTKAKGKGQTQQVLQFRSVRVLDGRGDHVPCVKITTQFRDWCNLNFDDFVSFADVVSCRARARGRTRTLHN